MLLTCCIDSNWSTRLLVLPKTRIILHLCHWQNEVLVQRLRALSMHLDAKLLAASRITRSPNTPHTRRKKEHLSVKRILCLPHASRVRQASSRYTGQPWNHSEAGMTFFLFCWPFFFFWLPWPRPKHAHNLSTVGIINDYYIPPSILRLISIIIRDLGIPINQPAASFILNVCDVVPPPSLGCVLRRRLGKCLTAATNLPKIL